MSVRKLFVTKTTKTCCKQATEYTQQHELHDNGTFVNQNSK